MCLTTYYSIYICTTYIATIIFCKYIHTYKHIIMYARSRILTSSYYNIYSNRELVSFGIALRLWECSESPPKAPGLDFATNTAWTFTVGILLDTSEYQAAVCSGSESPDEDQGLGTSVMRCEWSGSGLAAERAGACPWSKGVMWGEGIGKICPRHQLLAYFPVFIGLHASQLAQDFVHQQYYREPWLGFVQDYLGATSSDITRHFRNADPDLHPFERAREYQRALKASLPSLCEGQPTCQHRQCNFSVCL